ncbi:alpha- and gamma-adaptin-binding protein p34 isoform X2 [Tiliqua scincoides]|uniref:alpha- and gamma-adaptin-binding protein p34 isoform X2 n=1 Tax=Tiliqua scincoides TaxID=71010 RepID=UPI003462102D
MAVPCALVTSCAAEFPGEELVKRIIGTEELPQDVSSGGGVHFYPWTIDNKYYSADIHLCVVPNRFLVTAEIAESVQAFLIYFDSTTISGLDGISAWLPLVEEWLPEVMILVCDRVCENGVSRQKAQEWCIKHSFELVELSPEELPDEDDDFPESTGVKRIIQALNANVWSNVVMKNDVNQGFGFLTALVGANHSIGSEENDASEPNPLPVERIESTTDAGGGVVEADSLQANTVADPMLDMDIQELASLSAGEGDLENFGRLFSKLKEMKEKAATLPHEQRKLHAEKVTKAFWMAIGGDRDEIEGLSSDEEI